MLYRTLLSGLVGCGLWLKSFLLNVLLPPVSGIFRSGDSGSHMNSLPGVTVCYITVHPPHPPYHYITYSHSCRLFICLPERPLQKMPHRDDGKTLSENDFNHRPQPSSLDNRVLYDNASHESLSQFYLCKTCTLNVFWRNKVLNNKTQEINCNCLVYLKKSDQLGLK